MQEFVLVDPAELFLPTSRPSGADPFKYARQFSKFGFSLAGMPPLELIRGKDGLYRVNDGVTRASRAAKYCPGQLILGVVIDDLPGLDVTRMLQIKDVLP